MKRFACLSPSLLLLLLGGCESPVPPAPVAATAQPVPVKSVLVAQQETRRTTSQPATVHAFYETEIRSKLTGYLQEVRVDLGDYVEAGAPLAIVDVPELRQQRKVLTARLARCQAEIKRAAAGIDLAQARVAAAAAKLNQSKSELSRVAASLAAAEAEFNRTQDLVQRQSLADRMLDEARKKRDSELANRESIAASIVSAEAELGVAEAGVAAAEADMLAAEADTQIATGQLAELDANLAFATLTAPFAGRISQRHANPGNLVQATADSGQGRPLFVLSQVDRVRVHVRVPEVEAAVIRQGDVIELSFPSFPNESLTTAVTRLSGTLDPSTRTMLVEAEVDNADQRLLAGMFGQAAITLATNLATNVLPARAVRFEESGQAYVYVIDQDTSVRIAPVTTGFDNGSSIEILSGVEAGAQVVDAHLQRFVDGQQVVVLNP